MEFDANLSVGTEHIGYSILKTIADEINVKLQPGKGMNGPPSGSTLGPIIASQTGLRVMDIGVPVQSMHSIREMGGVLDILALADLCKNWLIKFGEVSNDLFNI